MNIRINFGFCLLPVVVVAVVVVVDDVVDNVVVARIGSV